MKRLTTQEQQVLEEAARVLTRYNITEIQLQTRMGYDLKRGSAANATVAGSDTLSSAVQAVLDKAYLELVPDRIYWVAGQGPLKLRSVEHISIRFSNMDGYDYWAGRDQVSREATAEDVSAWIVSCVERNVLPKGFKPSW